MPAIKEKNNLASATADREIVHQRLLDAPRELVWEAFTDPKQIVQWWGPRGFRTTIHQMDLRPGGVWHHTMHGPDGTDYPNKSIFTEVVKPERIVFAHGGGKTGAPGASFEATWTFEAQGDKTLLTGRMVFPTAAARDLVVKEYGAIEGGKQTLDRLEEQLEKMPIVVERTFNAPVKKVWAAITEIDQMKLWYMPALESFEPTVGFETEFSVHHEGKDFPHIWKVTEVVAEKKITYDWRFKGNPGISFVTFELFPQGDQTRLKLTHRGLETFEPKRHPELARKNFQQGWTQLGTELSQFLEKSAGAAGETFVLTRAFDAPRELVFKAWTEPERLAQWWGGKGCTWISGKMDLRPGGIFHYCMRWPNGHEMWGKFIYREIAPPERLVFVVSFSDAQGGTTRHPMSAHWPLEVLNTMILTEKAGKTTMTLQGLPINATAEERKAFKDGHKGMEQGFKGTLDRLVEYLATA